MGQAHATPGADDDRVRITTWTFAATGDATGHHRHGYDYIVVPVTGGTFTVTDLDGSVREMTQVAGEPYSEWREQRTTWSARPTARRCSSRSS